MHVKGFLCSCSFISEISHVLFKHQHESLQADRVRKTILGFHQLRGFAQKDLSCYQFDSEVEFRLSTKVERVCRCDESYTWWLKDILAVDTLHEHSWSVFSFLWTSSSIAWGLLEFSLN